MSNKHLSKRLAEHRDACLNDFDVWAEGGYRHELRPESRAIPEELRGMTCGAKTRAGTPCKLTQIYMNGRCKLHGGRSTGPKSDEGKRRSAANGHVPKKKRTP
jgi:hypothetical protein